MIDDLLDKIKDLKAEKGRINDEIIKLTDQAAAEMKQVLHGDKKTRKKREPKQLAVVK